MTSPLSLFATTPKGMEQLLYEELSALGAADVRATRAGVAFTGDLGLAYRVCLWSRIASRVLLRLARVPAPSADALYAGVQTIAWSEHLAAHATLAVDFNGANTAIRHTHFGALKVKDAIVDQLRTRFGARPSVDTLRPDVRINVYLDADEATIGIDLSGDSLHRRGYRTETVTAPLKENLAAAILLRAQWPEIARAGGAFVDLMCGSGTLPIEAALIAADCAPGLLRGHFGFLHWRQHDPRIWRAFTEEAHARRAQGLTRLPPIHGYDSDNAAVRAAHANIDKAGLCGHVHVAQRELGAGECPRDGAPGIVVANPPYGERLGERTQLGELYALLGGELKRCYRGWHAAVFTGDAVLGKRLGLRACRIHSLFNGALECKLLHFEVDPRWFIAPGQPRPAAVAASTAGSEMFANRLRKNLKHLGAWLKREGITCYRLYDADMPEYAVAVDVYDGERRFVHVQEYAPPATVDAQRARSRLAEVLTGVAEALDVPAADIFLKVRRRQKGAAQYERLSHGREFHAVQEGGCRFLVNFTDYLDTGLFLDHRITRRMLRELASGRRFLNLFGYTGTATVYAAMGGATGTTTVDMSNTYLDWTRRNLALNGLAGEHHELIQADVLKWLDNEARRRYGLVFLDPPTFSNSKRMAESFDVQRDHVVLIHKAARMLEPGGVLIFSTNHQRFRLDAAALADLAIEDLSRATVPKDFARNPRVHRCWRLTRAPG